MRNTKRKTERRVSFGEITQVLKSGVEGADRQRAKGLERLLKLRTVKMAVDQREVDRLREGETTDADRIARLEQRITLNQNLTQATELELVRIKTPQPPLEDNVWTVHGYVRDVKMKAVPCLTVSLHDARGRRDERFETTMTDANGYFRLTYQGKPTQQEQPASSSRAGVFLHVHADKEPVHADHRPLIPHSRGRDYREITLRKPIACQSSGKDSPQTTSETIGKKRRGSGGPTPPKQGGAA